MRTTELLSMWLSSDPLPGPAKAGKATSGGEAEKCPHMIHFPAAVGVAVNIS